MNSGRRQNFARDGDRENPPPNARSARLRADAGALTTETDEAGWQQAIHEPPVPAKPDNRCSGVYARNSRASTSEPVHRTLHAQRGTVHDVDSGLRQVQSGDIGNTSVQRHG